MRFNFPLVCFLTLAACAGNLFAQAPQTKYTILYTGRLLGYARIPDSQVLNESPSTTPNDVARDYQKQFDAARKDSSGSPIVVLGMGDNFAPDLFARTAEFKTPGPTDDTCACLPGGAPGRVPKDRVYFDGSQWVCWEHQAGRHHPL